MDKDKKPVVKKSVLHKAPAKKRVLKHAVKEHLAKEHIVKEHAPKLVSSDEIAITASPKSEPKKPIIAKNLYAVGRRKTAVSQVILNTGSGKIIINKLPFEEYFQTQDLRSIVLQPLVSIGLDKTLDIMAKIHGSGIHSQAESMRHAISRALIIMDPESRRTLKKQGFLTRDSRVKERKKPGLKRARRAPQFSKR